MNCFLFLKTYYKPIDTLIYYATTIDSIDTILTGSQSYQSELQGNHISNNQITELGYLYTLK